MLWIKQNHLYPSNPLDQHSLHTINKSKIHQTNKNKEKTNTFTNIQTHKHLNTRHAYTTIKKKAHKPTHTHKH